ncbi:hypothetical protein HXX76_003509 [Chlamydomonas incerta]|uniref:Uncharacterized protein n=1 Tax=Chlamydomonas incerta TaxID=51695 RepID=A0A835TEI5_CHLIN|nr:hypothetical protein HXX76_003509 [Chlamydomonas incerta]|eukprot:KAG2441903.1 hypothetical protein HXX76_003509 [Chlamydomonas incerta]
MVTVIELQCRERVFVGGGGASGVGRGAKAAETRYGAGTSFGAGMAAGLGPDGCSDRVAKAAKTLGPTGCSDRSAKAAETLGPTGCSDRSVKGWEKRLRVVPSAAPRAGGLCAVDGCSKPAGKKWGGKCQAHYTQEYRRIRDEEQGT